MSTLKDMPDVIWAKPFVGTYTGGIWYDIKPTAKMIAFYSSSNPFCKYIKDNANAEIFCWNQTPLDRRLKLRGWYRLARLEQHGATIGYRKQND